MAPEHPPPPCSGRWGHPGTPFLTWGKPWVGVTSCSTSLRCDCQGEGGGGLRSCCASSPCPGCAPRASRGAQGNSLSLLRSSCTGCLGLSCDVSGARLSSWLPAVPVVLGARRRFHHRGGTSGQTRCLPPQPPRGAGVLIATRLILEPPQRSAGIRWSPPGPRNRSQRGMGALPAPRGSSPRWTSSPRASAAAPELSQRQTIRLHPRSKKRSVWAVAGSVPPQLTRPEAEQRSAVAPREVLPSG